MPIVLSVIILILSVIIHEVSHGYMAYWLGDPTPMVQGRLTLNPIRHIDPVGSIIVPLITSLFGFTFGWAKPVIYDPRNIKNKRSGEFLIAMAGPVSNLVLAFIFGMIMRFTIDPTGYATPFAEVLSYIVIINIVLAIFNLIPLPPLDGSKLLMAFMPNQYGPMRLFLESTGPAFILIVVFVLWRFVWPLVPIIFKLLTNM